MTRTSLMLLLLTAAPAWADADAARVLACMRANVPPAARVQQIELTSTDRGGSARTLKGRLFVKSEREHVRAMLRVDEPADFAGAAYLLLQTGEPRTDGAYVYLPAVKRARRITGTQADGPLLGSNFSYNDFRQMQTALVDASALLEDPEAIEGRPVHVLSFRPPPDGEGQQAYTLVRVWVDQHSCVPLKTEFSEGLDVARQLSASAASLRQQGNYWYPAEARVSDLQSGGSSVLRVLGMSVNVAVPEAYFDPGGFFLAR